MEQRPIAAEEEFRDLKDVLLAASVVLIPAISAEAAVIVVIKQVHTVVQITEEHAQLQIIELRSNKFLP